MTFIAVVLTGSGGPAAVRFSNMAHTDEHQMLEKPDRKASR